MDLMTEVSPHGTVQPTQLSHKLTIDGRSRVYQVFRIRLDRLHYNPHNDRIATRVSQYRAETGLELPSPDDPAYNDLIERFVISSNEDAIRKTTNNIRLFDQRVPAVVLDSGLVVDGNRRLTCLRILARESARFGWLEAVILPTELADDPKRIKLLELSIQHGEEGKVDYDLVDRLAGIYSDIIHERLLTIEEYAQATGLTVREVQSMVSEAGYLAEFLEFVNAPGQFHLVRELSVMDAITSMPSLMRACSDEETEETVRQLVYANLAAGSSGPGALVRSFKRILSTPAAQEFLEREVELAAEVVERLAQTEGSPAETIRDGLRADESIKRRLSDVLRETDARAKGAKVRSTPVDAMSRALSLLEGIDAHIVERLNADEVRRCVRAIDDLTSRVEDLRMLLGVDVREA